MQEVNNDGPFLTVFFLALIVPMSLLFSYLPTYSFGSIILNDHI
ncbi:DUF6007 family protein [Virgibacillus natechei]